MNLKRTLRRTLDRLGVAYTEQQIGWRGSERYGFAPIVALVVSDDDYERVVKPDRQRTAAKRNAANAKARQRRREEIESLAADLGVLSDSRTLAAYRRGDIDADEARRIGEITRRRHETTNYDDLLAAGLSKDDARACMKEN